MSYFLICCLFKLPGLDAALRDVGMLVKADKAARRKDKTGVENGLIYQTLLSLKKYNTILCCVVRLAT